MLCGIEYTENGDIPVDIASDQALQLVLFSRVHVAMSIVCDAGSSPGQSDLNLPMSGLLHLIPIVAEFLTVEIGSFAEKDSA